MIHMNLKQVFIVAQKRSENDDQLLFSVIGKISNWWDGQKEGKDEKKDWRKMKKRKLKSERRIQFLTEWQHELIMKRSEKWKNPLMNGRCLDPMSSILILGIFVSLLPSCSLFESGKCSKLFEAINYFRHRSSSDPVSQVPTYSDSPNKVSPTVLPTNFDQRSLEPPSYNADMYIESTDQTIDAALKQEIESSLKIPIPFQIPQSSVPTSYLNQEGRGSKKTNIVNYLHGFITWEENESRKTSKFAKVVGTVAGDIASLVIAERFQKVGMAAGDLARIFVSDLTIRGLDGFRGMLGIKIWTQFLIHQLGINCENFVTIDNPTQKLANWTFFPYALT